MASRSKTLKQLSGLCLNRVGKTWKLGLQFPVGDESGQDTFHVRESDLHYTEEFLEVASAIRYMALEKGEFPLSQYLATSIVIGPLWFYISLENDIQDSLLITLRTRRRREYYRLSFHLGQRFADNIEIACLHGCNVCNFYDQEGT